MLKLRFKTSWFSRLRAIQRPLDPNVDPAGNSLITGPGLSQDGYSTVVKEGCRDEEDR